MKIWLHSKVPLNNPSPGLPELQQGQGQPQGHPKHWAQRVTSKGGSFLSAEITPDLPHLSLNCRGCLGGTCTEPNLRVGKCSTPASLRHHLHPDPSPGDSKQIWVVNLLLRKDLELKDQQGAKGMRCAFCIMWYNGPWRQNHVFREAIKTYSWKKICKIEGVQGSFHTGMWSSCW